MDISGSILNPRIYHRSVSTCKQVDKRSRTPASHPLASASPSRPRNSSSEAELAAATTEKQKQELRKRIAPEARNARLAGFGSRAE